MITFTKDKTKAHRFPSWTEAGNWAGAHHGAKGPVPIGWRLQELSGFPSDAEATIIHLPGIIDQYVESIDTQPAEPDNSWEPLGPEYGQTLGGSADIETVGDLIDLLGTCDRSEVLRVQVRGTGSLRSVHNLNDTATTTGHPIVILRTH